MHCTLRLGYGDRSLTKSLTASQVPTRSKILKGKYKHGLCAMGRFSLGSGAGDSDSTVKKWSMSILQTAIEVNTCNLAPS
jgi:hypothetical protein